jgi:hypothetical protein
MLFIKDEKSLFFAEKWSTVGPGGHMKPLVTFLSILALALCAGCKDQRLQQVAECRIEANHLKPEICNGVDDNCSNSVDEGCDDDGDGFCDASMAMDANAAVCPEGGGDCDDDAPAVHPGLSETCDGKDNDCNGQVDDGVTHNTDPRVEQVCGQDIVPAAKVGIGPCKLGTTVCQGGTVICDGANAPKPEECDGIDNDCNRLTDDGAHLFEICQDPVSNPNLVGECRPGVYRCVNGRMDRARCDGEVKPSAEICDSKDNDCDGRTDNDCGMTITCPADITVATGMPTTLTVVATTQAGTIAGYGWMVTSGPAGGVGTPGQWTPDPPNAATETFKANVVGIYVIRATATNSLGASLSCETRVTVVDYSLRVELTWDGTGDMDLHLHDGVTSSPWFYATDMKHDCFYGNRAPDWDVAGYAADDPLLDHDNVVSFGSENTRIPLPVVGETYTIGVHNFSNGAGRIATIKVFCGPGSAPKATYVSRAFTGNAGGQCTTSDFWKPANVVFTSPSTCVVSLLDAWSDSNSRCQAF